MMHFTYRLGFAYEIYNENIIGLYMKSKQLTLIEESICLTILSVNSVYKVFRNVSITYILL